MENQCGEPELSGAKYRVLSLRMREGLVAYDLMPSEFLLAMMLVLETFDLDKSRGSLALRDWAERMGLRDSKGVRVDKCERVFRSLVELGIVDLNEGQGTYEPRPDTGSWSRLRAFRAKIAPSDDSQTTLALSAERPLSEAMSAASRENALISGQVPERDLPVLFSKLKEAVQRGASEAEFEDLAGAARGSAEKSADVGEIRRNAGAASAEKSAEKQTPTGPAQDRGKMASAKFAETPSLAIASLACIEKAKLAKQTSAEKSAESAERAFRWLMEVDPRGHLRDSEASLRQWRQLCERDPGYVLGRLRGAYEYRVRQVENEDYEPINDPLAWIARKAVEEGKLRRVRYR